MGQAAANAGKGIPTGQQAREQAINAAYGSATSRLDPQWNQRDASMRTQLANEGLDPNSEAARRANLEESQSRNDAYNQALSSAIGQGTQAGNAIFQQGLQSSQLPYEQMQALQGLLQQQGYNQAGRAETPQMLEAAINQFGQEKDISQMQNQQMGELGGALGGIVGQLPNLFAMSDERLKTSIVREPKEALPGVPWATWHWKHTNRPRRVRGVIAQDLQRVAPELVRTAANGFLEVDYLGLAKRMSKCPTN